MGERGETSAGPLGERRVIGREGENENEELLRFQFL